MKIKKSELQQIIKEELEATMAEGIIDDYIAKPVRKMKRQVVGQKDAASQIEQWASRAASLLDRLESSGYKDEYAAKQAYRFADKVERSASVSIDGMFNSPQLTSALRQFGNPKKGMNPDPRSRQEAADSLRDALRDVATRAQDYLEGNKA